MRNMRLSLVLFLLIFCASGEADDVNLSFDCKRISTKTERAVCNAENDLGDLNTALKVVYEKALSISSNQGLVKESQKEWQKNCDIAIETLDENSEIVEKLTELYSLRILELLHDEELRHFFLQSASNFRTINHTAFLLAVTAAWKKFLKQDTGIEDFDPMALRNIGKHSVLVQMRNGDFLVMLHTNVSATSLFHSFLVMRFKDLATEVLPLSFEKPKKSLSQDTSKSEDFFPSLGSADIILTPEGAKYFISSSSGGWCCDKVLWEIDGTSAKLVSEEKAVCVNTKDAEAVKRCLDGKEF